MPPAPTFPGLRPVPVKAWALSSEGFRPEPFGPGRSLGFRAGPRGLPRFPNRTSTEISRLRWLPGPESFSALLLRRLPSQARRPKAPFPPDHRGKWVRLSPRASSSTARSATCARPSFRSIAAFAEAAAAGSTPFPEGRSSAAKVLSEPAIRFAPAESCESKLWITGILWITFQGLRIRLSRTAAGPLSPAPPFA